MSGNSSDSMTIPVPIANSAWPIRPSGSAIRIRSVASNTVR
jgi:hypothetical protein